MMAKQLTERFSRYTMGSIKTPGKLERLHVALVESEIEVPCEYMTFSGLQQVTTYGLRLKGYAADGDFDNPMYAYEFNHLHVDKDLVLLLMGAITCNELRTLRQVFAMINAFRAKHGLAAYDRAGYLFMNKIAGFRGKDSHNARKRGEVFLHFHVENSVYFRKGGRAQ